MAIEIGYIRDEDIRARAEGFLTEFHPSNAIPVPIVEIVEFDLGIELFPLPDAERLFGFMAALSSDLQTIVYDENSDKRSPPRFRYTIAHEIGHRELHGDLIRSLNLTSKQDWKRTISEIDPRMYSRIEFQAYIFAEYVLVPTVPLIESFEAAKRRAIENGIDLSEAGESAVGFVAGSIARRFEVSTAVIDNVGPYAEGGGAIGVGPPPAVLDVGRLEGADRGLDFAERVVKNIAHGVYACLPSASGNPL